MIKRLEEGSIGDLKRECLADSALTPICAMRFERRGLAIEAGTEARQCWCFLACEHAAALRKSRPDPESSAI